MNKYICTRELIFHLSRDVSLGRLCSNSLISSATTTSRNLTSAPRGWKIVCKRFFFSTTARRVTSPTWGPRLHVNGPLLSWFLPSAIAETKAYDEVFSLSPPWRVSDRFFERSGKRFTQESPKIRSWRWCAVFYWSEKMVSLKDGFTAETSSSKYWKLVTLTNLLVTSAVTRREKRFVLNSVMLLLNFKIVVTI